MAAVSLVDIGPARSAQPVSVSVRSMTSARCDQYGLWGIALACSTNRPPGARRWLTTMEAITPADVADDPAQPGAQDAQLPLMPPELFGMIVAARHHRGGLGDPRIRLPQFDAPSPYASSAASSLRCTTEPWFANGNRKTELQGLSTLKLQIHAISNARPIRKQTPAQSLRALFTDDYRI